MLVTCIATGPWCATVAASLRGDEFDAERIENYRVFRKDWHGQRIFWLRYHPGGPDMDIVFTEELLDVLKKCRLDEDQEIYPVAWA